jgi:polyhydroxyalkanoate synthesis regulator phasin
MLEEVRRNVRGFVEAGMEAVSGVLTPSKARELARSMTGGEGVNRVAQDLLEWSQRSREWITEAVAKEVKRQLSSLGIATRDDLDALKKRVRELERASGAKRPARKTAAKSTSAKTSARSSDPGPGPATT